MLRIGRLQTTCHVPDGPFAPAVLDRASRACREHIARALYGAARWLDSHDDSVWIVRRIELSITTSIEAPPDELALSIARSLGRALAKALTGDGDGTNAIRFRSRAAYLSRFVADVAAGAAWTRWYFTPLSGWRLLTASAAILSALVEEPGIGLDALTSLEDRELEKVVGCLTFADERVILQALGGRSLDEAPTEREMSSASRRHRSTIAVVTPRTLTTYVRATTAAARRVAQQEDAKLGTPDDRPATSSSQRTKFGGVVLLLRDLNALPWKTWTADWPQPFETVSAETCLKWLTLAACSGKANAAALLGDDVCRDLFGIPRVLPVADVARWLRAVGEEQTQIFSASAAADGLTRREMRWLGFPRNTGISRKWCTALSSVAWLVYRGFTRRLPGFANSSADYLWRNFLDIDAVVECEQNRVVVRCGRAPLHLVLSLTGMTRGLVASTDHRGRPIQVFSQA